MNTTTPTGETYSEFDEAFAYFNRELFGDELPPCLITLRMHRQARGYYWPKRFDRAGDSKRVIDEIAMNSEYFGTRSTAETLSTLVHEMVHLWQEHNGKPSRGGYHNAQWAGKMESVGLMPSNTAEPGGKRTGQTVSHYIIEGGAFDKACAKFLQPGFVISWREVSRKRTALTLGLSPGTEGEEGEQGEPKETKSGKRVKYTCGECDEVAVWGRSGLNLKCGECDSQLQPE